MADFIGLYAAVISMAVAHFVMLVYRHFDLKKCENKYRISDLALAFLGFCGDFGDLLLREFCFVYSGGCRDGGSCGRDELGDGRERVGKVW